MNYCNFAKVIIARSSKDPQSIEWCKNKAEGKSTGTILPTPQLSKFSNLVSAPKRYDFYQTIMHRYPKMYIPYKKFSSKLSKLQNYLTNNKYWKNANINGEKQQFLQKFSLDSWSLLSEREKHLHSLQDCARCEATDPSSSSLHRSVSEKTENIMFKADDLINEISTLTPNRTANGQLQMMNILEPIFESKFHTSLKNATSNFYSLTEKKTGVQKFQEKINETRKTGKRFPICYPMKMKLALFFHLVIHIIKEIGTDSQHILKHPKLQGVEVKNYPNQSNLVQGKPNNIQAR